MNNDDINEYRAYSIYYFTLIIYINLKLWDIKYREDIYSYYMLKNNIENIEINSQELNCKVIKYIMGISIFFCYKSYFEYDSIYFK